MEHPGGQKDGDLTSETEGCGEASKYQHFWTDFTRCEKLVEDPVSTRMADDSVER